MKINENGMDVLTEEQVQEIFKEGERFGNKLVLAAGIGLAVYVGYKMIIKPRRMEKKRKTQSEVIVEEENIEE